MMNFSTEYFSQLNIRIYDDVNQQANALADFISDSLKTILSKQEQAVLAVSGGRSPVLFFQALSIRELPWERICVTLVDERIVSPDSDESNAKLIRSFLLQNQAKDAIFMPWIFEASQFEADLIDLNRSLPSIDLVVLGLGDDGHTASWLPQSPQLPDLVNAQREDSVLYVATNGTCDRLSLTASAIKKVPTVVLQFAGYSKAKVFQAALLNIGTYPIEAALPFVTEVFVGR